ncbi:TonB-dependent receptor (plasmid) [Pedobacter sp. BS3]|uniref:SusC/RagA family TonB-linked outer membrane protein n=1 Tax=Pedobacter sp. BS3 TaxID=2567937 RepID=UPI0011F02322|nr:TonB-dependent receptor [Pedobacter sp. BS3]TZF86252.1 TonB-dependent receptor [Pedobacter sp. BS3]
MKILDKVIKCIQSKHNVIGLTLLVFQFCTTTLYSKDNISNRNTLFFQRDGKIMGYITDVKNEKLVGASIRIKELNLSTSSNINGYFEIKVPHGTYSVEVSYVSYQKALKSNIVVGDKAVQLNFVLEEDEATGLKEVVVVGFGRAKKESLVGAIASIDVSSLQERPLVDAGSLLQGVSPGLNIVRSTGKIGADARINIRGFTSINGGSPLVIIDGFEGDINNLNVNDIATISVLKDAGASAIYGARGAYGVILITTKNAQQGKMAIDVNISSSLNTPTVNTDFLTDPYQAIQLIDEAHKTATGATFSQYTDADYEALKEVSEKPYLARVIIANRNGRDQWVHYGHTDWWDYFNRKWSPSQQYSGSVSGGNEQLKSFFSFQHFNSLGILKVQDDTYQRDNLRGKFEIKVNNWLKFTNNSQYFSSKDLIHRGADDGTWGGDNDIIGWGSTMAPPFYMPVNPDGTAFYKTGLNQYTISGGRYASALYGKAIGQTDESEYSNFLTADVSPFKGFKVTGSYSFRQNHNESFQRSTKIPYSLYPGEIDYVGVDELSEYRTTSNYNAVNLYADYTVTLHKHNLKGLLGFNQEQFSTKNISASKQDNISDDLNSLNLASGVPENSGDGGEWALRGIFYRLSYDYMGKYLLELNGRYDGTSRFPKNSRWGFFPSTSAGWVVSKEHFMEGASDWLSLFKIRGSYGSLGNQNIGNYVYYSLLAKGVNTGYALDGQHLDYVGSPALTPLDITWEKVTTSNVGLDLSFFKDRLSINGDLFRRDTKGMLTQSAMLPSVLGTSSPLANAADLRTNGFEISLGYKDQFNLGGKPFHFGLSANLSNTKTKITHFDNPAKSLLDYYTGMTIGEIWGYHIEGLFQSPEDIANHANQQLVAARQINTGGLQPGDVKYADLDGDMRISPGANTVDNPGDRRIIGNSVPQYLYGLRLEASWNGIDVSAFFNGVGKQDWYPHTNARIFWNVYSQSYSSFIRKDMLNDMWSPENPNAYFPRLWGFIAFNDNATLSTVNDRYLQDISYLRLKNLTIGYTLPSKWIIKGGLKRARLFFSGENLLTLTKLTKYVDPEAAGSTVNFNQVSASAYRSAALVTPFMASYSFGISLQF